MVSRHVIAEFRSVWLPNITDAGLTHLTKLLQESSPYLIHGTFSRCLPQGCLASHVAWHHPRTRHLDIEAGIAWLAKVAGLNPATSKVVLAWDELGRHDFALRSSLLQACRTEAETRAERCPVLA
jgi:hypothetical protein